VISHPSNNLELKARDPDPRSTLRAAIGLGATDYGSFEQRDTVYWLPAGRLKLRRQGNAAELIHYLRLNQSRPAPSQVCRAPLADPDHTAEVLEAYLGVTGVVEKTRRLLVKDNVRIHLDQVEGLGSFVELEALVPPGFRPQSQLAAINVLRRALAITDDRLLPGAYADYLNGQAA
jgi:adenylate cyclase class IV